MNKVVKFSEYGGTDVLRVEIENIVEPKAGEVRLRMSALALNRANALFREGTYLFEAAFPSRIGTEGVGLLTQLVPMSLTGQSASGSIFWPLTMKVRKAMPQKRLLSVKVSCWPRQRIK